MRFVVFATFALLLCACQPDDSSDEAPRAVCEFSKRCGLTVAGESVSDLDECLPRARAYFEMLGECAGDLSAASDYVICADSVTACPATPSEAAPGCETEWTRVREELRSCAD